MYVRARNVSRGSTAARPISQQCCMPGQKCNAHHMYIYEPTGNVSYMYVVWRTDVLKYTYITHMALYYNAYGT